MITNEQLEKLVAQLTYLRRTFVEFGYYAYQTNRAFNGLMEVMKQIDLDLDKVTGNQEGESQDATL